MRRLRCHPWIRSIVVAWLTISTVGHAPVAQAQPMDSTPSAVRCRLELPDTVRAGAPLPLTMVLHNRGRVALRVLTWGTPFEGAWLQPFVSVLRAGTPLPYQGATVKRGAPEASEYLRLPAGASRRAALDLRDAFDLSAPGDYRVVAEITLHDVIRNRQHVVVHPRCADLTLTITR